MYRSYALVPIRCIGTKKYLDTISYSYYHYEYISLINPSRSHPTTYTFTYFVCNKNNSRIFSK